MNVTLTKAELTRSMLLATSVALALLGGVYFGLYSCGSMAYHHAIFSSLTIFLFVAWLIASLVAYRATEAARRRPTHLIISLVLFWPAMRLLYLLVMSATAPFYPAAPESVTQWSSAFWNALASGSAC